MTKIKLCGLTREIDIDRANELAPDYIGFVFAPKSKRYTTPENAERLKKSLDKSIKAVGVFVNEPVESVARLLKKGIIDIAQLHGNESEEYISTLRQYTQSPVFKAFRIDSAADVERANASSADMVLLDSGSGGTGEVFDWTVLKKINRDYFLAGGLNAENVAEAVSKLKPWGVDVSSGIETDSVKDKDKMKAFVENVRKEDAR